MADLLIDPSTRDYIDDGAGGMVTTTTPMTRAYLALTVALNKSAIWPKGGSRLHLLTRKITDKNVRQFADWVREALEPLVSAGYIRDLTVSIGTNFFAFS